MSARLGYTKTPPRPYQWSESRVAVLRHFYPRSGAKGAAREIGCTERQAQSKAQHLGLHYMSQCGVGMTVRLIRAFARNISARVRDMDRMRALHVAIDGRQFFPTSKPVGIPVEPGQIKLRAGENPDRVFQALCGLAGWVNG